MLLNLGLVAYELGNYVEATNYFRRGVTLAQRTNLTLQLCRHYASLGLVETAQSHFSAAHIHYEEALLLAHQLDSIVDICRILNYQGEGYLKQNKLREATAVFQEVQQITHTTNLQAERAKCLYGLARIDKQLGNMELAYQHGQESEIILTKANHKRASEVRIWLQELPKVG